MFDADSKSMRDTDDAARWLVNLYCLARKTAPDAVTVDFQREVSQAYNGIRQKGARRQFAAIGTIESVAEKNGNRVFVRALRAARVAYRRVETRSFVP